MFYEMVPDLDQSMILHIFGLLCEQEKAVVAVFLLNYSKTLVELPCLYLWGAYLLIQFDWSNSY